MANRITGKFSRVMTGANLDIADVEGQVIQAMGNCYSVCQRFSVMVEHFNPFRLGVQASFPIQLTNQFFF